MTVLTVPDDKGKLWPTLGPEVCAFIEDALVFGPGDLRGEPAVLDDEKRALIYRMYEVYPKGHGMAGRRRFKRAALSLAKGLAKTELAAWIAACELHAEAPVRFDGWGADGNPVGKGVRDPYIPLVAYTEEQSDELAYGTLRTILEEGPLADDFDIGLERIMRKAGDGRAVSLSSSPNARDGARTTFQVLDETHWWTLARLKQAHQTMMANLPKRKMSDPWALEVTTAPEPGAGSVAEATMEYAQAVSEGRQKDSRLFFFHRQAADSHDLETREGRHDAVVEASGPAAEWRDIDGIVALADDPTTDLAYWERVWTNRLVKSESKAFDPLRWDELSSDDGEPQDGETIVLGFDGSMFNDSTALLGGVIATRHIFVLGIWERPYNATEWQVPVDEVDDAVMAAFERWNVWRLYGDPPYWQAQMSKWAGQFGSERVIEWWTNRRQQMTRSLESFQTAIKSGDVSHDGNADLRRHIANSVRHDLPQRDEQGRPLYLIRKERSDSPNKIDAAMAAVLAVEAMNDAVAAGVSGGPERETAGVWF